MAFALASGGEANRGRESSLQQLRDDLKTASRNAYRDLPSRVDLRSYR